MHTKETFKWKGHTYIWQKYTWRKYTHGKDIHMEGHHAEGHTEDTPRVTRRNTMRRKPLNIMLAGHGTLYFHHHVPSSRYFSVEYSTSSH